MDLSRHIFFFIPEQYLRRNPAGSNQIVWWIMENRLEYFNRSKHMLSQVKMLTFLTEIQSNQWLSWCKEENIKLKSQPMVVPLSVNDELAFAAGIPCSLNTPAFSVEKMMEKRDLLRIEVRTEMGLSDNDMLVMTLSSVNPAKGQLSLLEAAHLVAERNVSRRDSIVIEKDLSLDSHLNQTTVNNVLGEQHLETNQTENTVEAKRKPTSGASKKRKRKRPRANSLSLRNDSETAKEDQRKLRRLLSDKTGTEEQSLKVLIGSIGSKSNKVSYVKGLLRFISQNSNMSKIVLWTRATTRVASLYAAADVYIINSQVIVIYASLFMQCYLYVNFFLKDNKIISCTEVNSVLYIPWTKILCRTFSEANTDPELVFGRFVCILSL